MHYITFNSLFFIYAHQICVLNTNRIWQNVYISNTLFSVREILNAFNIEHSGRAQRKSDFFSQLISYGGHSYKISSNLAPGIEMTTCALCSDSWIIDSIVAKNTIFENDMSVIDNPLNDTE